MKNIISYILCFFFSSIILIGQDYQVSGKVTKGDGTALASVRVELRNLLGGNQWTYTNEDGTYNFQMLEGGEYIVELGNVQEITSRNNISVFDVLLIRRHILGIEDFEEDYQLIAADANNSGSISTFDMIMIHRFILDPRTSFRRVAIYYRELEEGIVDSGTSFMISDNITDLDFIGLQVGDVGNL